MRVTDLQAPDNGLHLAQRPDSLTFSVYNTIREAIVDGRLEAASRVTEAGLAKQLNVSKTPVREALLRLREIGLIEADGPKFGRIVTPSRARTQEAYEVREALETHSARLAAERGDRDMLFAARREAEITVVAAEQHDVTRYRAADDAFHATVAASTNNTKLARLINDTNALISALRQRQLPGVDASPICASQHMAIAEALLGGDAEEAVARMGEHVRHVSRQVLTHFVDGT